MAMYSLLFLFGASVGSFINVLGFRYSEKEGFKPALRGRSRCPHCGKTLQWYELIPLVSFVVQRRKCRTCSVKLSWQYPLVEVLSGAAVLLVPLALGQGFPALLWSLAFLTFILVSIVDLRLRIIPDELVIFILLLGILLVAFYEMSGMFGLIDGVVHGSFLGSYALSFWPGPSALNPLVNALAGALFGTLLFGILYFLSRGRAMGFGDVKLAAAVGLLLGWPDTVLALTLAFITGGITGAALLLRGKKSMKDHIPFGPFIIAGVTLVFFFGYDIINGYFSAISLY